MATLLWEDLPETAVQTNLRIELSNLKKVLAENGDRVRSCRVLARAEEWIELIAGRVIADAARGAFRRCPDHRVLQERVAALAAEI